MTDTWRATAVPPAEVAAYYEQVASFQGWRERYRRNSVRLWGIVAGVSLTANIALAAAVTGLVPSQHLVPVLLNIHSDGTADSETSITALPASMEQQVIRAALWRYVADRESYSWAGAPERYAFVTALSGPNVRDEYQHWFQPMNKFSPQNIIGKKGQIDVSMIAISFPTVGTSNTVGVAIIRYRHILQYYGQRPEETTWTSTLEYIIDSRVPRAVRDEGDPGGIVIERYSAVQDTPSS